MRPFTISTLAAAALLATGPVAAEGIDEQALSFSSEGFANAAQKTKAPPAASSEKTSPTAPTQGAASGFYIYDAWSHLYYDDDHDGHYYGIRVTFDADTDYFHADVYARLSLSLDGGPWIAYYTTEVFGINGSSGLDDYVVETELFSGYPTGYYDLRIELFDIHGHRVDEFGPYDTSLLSYLPLEDQQKDAGYGGAPPVSYSSGGGGAPGPLALLALGGLAVSRWRRR